MLSLRGETGRRRVIGVAVLLVAALLTWLGIVKPNPFAYHEYVEAEFSQVQGIALVQRDVRVSGVNVGTIGAVHRIGNHAEVQLILDRHIPIYRDATADLRPHTPFEGTAFVDLSPGTAGAGPLGNAPIPLSHTSVFVSAGTVLSTFTAPVRRGFQTIVGQLSIALGHRGQLGLRGALSNAPDLLRDTAAVAPALRGAGLHPQDALQSLIPAMAHTVDAVSGQDDQLGTAVHDASTTLDALTTDDTAPIGQSLDRLPAALAALTTAGVRTQALTRAAGASTADLIPTLYGIPRDTPAITGVLRQAGPELSAASAPIDAFATALDQLQRNGDTLGRLLSELGTIGHNLRTGLIPTIDRRTSLGLPTYLQIIAATTGLTGVLDSYVTQAQVGGHFATGHDLRVTIQTPDALPLAALDIPCSAISALNANAVPVVEALGLCTT